MLEAHNVHCSQFQVLAESIRNMQMPPPPNKWYALAFDNFDLNRDGMISYTDVLEILTQYVDAFIEINNKDQSVLS